MKVLVFAHTPPPHHGQSYMVKLMVDGLGGDCRRLPEAQAPTAIECYHVNSRFSEDIEDIGALRMGKGLLIFKYCLEALWCRFRYGTRAFYYVPAPGKRGALYRDWLVMLLCRPFFRVMIHHWHAVGLGDWLRTEGFWFERWLTHRLLGRPSMGVVLGVPSMRDALWFRSEKVKIVQNGIPDPCPEFEEKVQPRRRARLAARRALLAGTELDAAQQELAGSEPQRFRILYLAHCTADKGLFDTLDAVILANSYLRSIHSPILLSLTVAGKFLNSKEEELFKRQYEIPEVATSMHYAGFVSGEEKARLLAESDCLCFPTYYAAEGQPVNLIEAMAYGLTIVTTRWRAIPEILPADYDGFVTPRRPTELADKLREMITYESSGLRERFIECFTAEKYLAQMVQAMWQAAV